MIAFGPRSWLKVALQDDFGARCRFVSNGPRNPTVGIGAECCGFFFPNPEESGSSLTAEEDDGEQSSGKEQRSLGSPRQSNWRLNGLAKRLDVGPPFEKRYQKDAG